MKTKSYLEQFLNMARGNDFLVLDTETTGLTEGEICQIAVVDTSGKVWFDLLIKTRYPIPKAATMIHGITDDMVADAPTWKDFAPALESFLRGRNVVSYNAIYDRKMMHHSAAVNEMEPIHWKEFSAWWCAMEAYAEFHGDWNSWHGNYRWQKLAVAAAHFNIPQNGAHSALGDCQTTLAVIHSMCAFERGE